MKFFPAIFILLALTTMSVQAAALLPSVLDVSAQRGQTVEQTLTVINTREIEQTYFLGLLKFEPKESGESPAFIPYETDHSGLPDWIMLPFTEFRVPAHSKGEVPYQITVPTDAQSGGYYGAITVSQAPSELIASNGAMVEAKTAALILLTVEGSMTEHLELLEFESEGESLSDLSQTFHFRLQNQGNAHVQPKGTIRFKDFFGRTLLETDANSANARVLPGSTRSFAVQLSKANGLIETLKNQMNVLAIGPLSAELTLTYGTNQNIYAEVKHWYFPWQLLLTALALLLIFGKLFTRWKNKSLLPNP